MLDYLSREVIPHDARLKLLIHTNAETLLDQNNARAKVEREVLWKFPIRRHARPFFRHFENFWTVIVKLINYSFSQKPINDDHLGQVDESWYLMKHQIKHHQVFIWDQTLAF